jgi:hypothetical protein
MEPITAILAAKVVDVLAPYVAKGGEEFARLAGQAAYEKCKTLLDTLKNSWYGDNEASTNLKLFSDKPERYKPVMEDILKEKLDKDKELAADIQEILADIGPELEIIQRIKVGENVIGIEADEVAGVKAKITQVIDQGKDITGAKIKRLGRS